MYIICYPEKKHVQNYDAPFSFSKYSRTDQNKLCFFARVSPIDLFALTTLTYRSLACRRANGLVLQYNCASSMILRQNFSTSQDYSWVMLVPQFATMV